MLVFETWFDEDAEWIARFNYKKYKYKQKKAVFAMLMPDYEINSYANCQVLVTVPNSFEVTSTFLNLNRE